jgi:hypothetical protein
MGLLVSTQLESVTLWEIKTYLLLDLSSEFSSVTAYLSRLAVRSE